MERLRGKETGGAERMNESGTKGKRVSERLTEHCMRVFLSCS
jgi:hypothetical protein